MKDYYNWIFKYTHLYGYRHYEGRYVKDDYAKSRHTIITEVFKLEGDSIYKTGQYFLTAKLFEGHKCFGYCIK